MTTINLDRPATKFISPDTEVWSRYAIELGHNGKQGDESQTLMIAPNAGPSFCCQSEFVYLETNGDPVEIGYIDDTGKLELSDWAREEVDQVCGDNGPDESHPSYWIFDALLAHGFEL